MLKTIFIALISFNVLFSNSTGNIVTDLTKNSPKGNTGTLEKMIVANGSVAMDVDLSRLGAKAQKSNILRFDVERDAFFTVIVFNDELRGPTPSSMGLIPQNTAALPAKMSASSQNLVVEKLELGGQYELAVRDGKTGFTFFNIEGQLFDYNPAEHLLSVEMGRLLLSKEFATELGRPSEAGSVVGQISISATMRPIEITQYDDGEVQSNVLPAPNAGSVPGPDVIVGDVVGLAQFGSSSGTQVGLSVGTDSCNIGTVSLNWFQLPANDHPTIPQNLYRMSGGATSSERFEQIGQSSVKHAFAALTGNLCNLGCQNPGTQTLLGSGCSDPYSASLNSGGGGNALGSRSWINPFTGAYPRGDSATPPNSHGGHTHTGPSHRILTEINDLNPTLNLGATYYAEAQYVTPHEFAWCQANPGQCNMNNNVSYRQYTVSGTTSFSFSPAASTVRTKAAIVAWTGSTQTTINPAPGLDGIGTIAYKVTNTSPGIWHYEYAIYNQNIDRAIQSFSVPIGVGITLTNVGFHAPPQHPGSAFDGTFGNAGYSNTPWASALLGGAITWSTETFAQNQNANAIRWGTMYNFRFDSNNPPITENATIGFFKTGTPIKVKVQVPFCTGAGCAVDGTGGTDTEE